MTRIDPRLTTQNTLPLSDAGVKPKGKSKSASQFESVLEQALVKHSLKFSQHAQQRMDARGIRLDPKQLTDLAAAVDKAGSKSARESLILMQDCAFVVSIPNKTVITIIDGDSIKENVFTNIDSAVIV